MQLFHNPASPFVRKVMVLLHETGHLDEVECIASGGTPLDSSNMPTAHNPLGKIPTLIDGDRPIFDSRIITRFLDDRFKSGLYGTAENTWDIQTLEAMADGMMEAAILMVYEWRVRPEEIRFAPWVDGQWQKALRGVAAIEASRMDLLTGPLNLGQIGTACALGYLDFRHPDRDWRTGNDRIAGWYADFLKRPSMQATIPVG